MVDPAFWDAVQAQSDVPQEPAFIAVTMAGGVERLLLVDASGPRIMVYATDGTLDQHATDDWHDLPVSGVGGLVFAGGVLYIGDPDGKRVLSFDSTGTLLGTAAGFSGAIVSLALDLKGRILVHPGGGGGVTVLAPEAAYATTGSFLAGPFSVTDRATAWHRVRITADPLPANAHVTLATYTGDTPAPPVWDPTILDSTTAFDQTLSPSQRWRAISHDATDFLVLHEPAQYLWIGGAFQGDGTGSPVFRQMRVSYDHDSYLRYLPAAYRSADPMSGFLARALELFESNLADTEETIQGLERLFDPNATPDDGAPASWLDWLSTWLDFPLDESWLPDRRRAAVAEAFALEGIRGTVEGLRRFIQLYANANAVIEEPALDASIWTLGETSLLGFDTMLAADEAQGAVLGTTAILDHSHLTVDQDYGVPLFEDIAHRFCVHVYETEVPTEEARSAIRDVIEREKPAHTTYDLCVIGARMRVGFQARLGIDSIVAGPSPPLALDDGLELGFDTVLPDSPHHPTPGRLDSESRVGPTQLT
jgi:phage tail-like protein